VEIQYQRVLYVPLVVDPNSAADDDIIPFGRSPLNASLGSLDFGSRFVVENLKLDERFVKVVHVAEVSWLRRGRSTAPWNRCGRRWCFVYCEEGYGAATAREFLGGLRELSAARCLACLEEVGRGWRTRFEGASVADRSTKC
jgi:hypothetical protein